MRTLRKLSCCIVLILIACSTAPAMAAEASLAEVMPAGTLLYVGWPGMDALSEASSDTELAKLLNEPEFARLRNDWHTKLLPAIEALIAEEADDETAFAMYAIGKELAEKLWRYPVAIGAIGVSLGETGPAVDAVIIVRAGKDAPALAEKFEKLATDAGLPIPAEDAPKVEVGDATLKELAMLGPTMPIRWGVIGDDFLISVGTKLTERLTAGEAAKSLAADERFATAMKTVSATPASPTLFLDIKGVVATLESFQPMFAGFEVPILGEEGGVQRILDGMDLGATESISLAMTPEAGGFKTSTFVHIPGVGSSDNAVFKVKPLTEADLAILPKDAAWAAVWNFDLLGMYRTILKSISAVSPDAQESVTEAIAEAEETVGIKIEDDLLGAFGDTWTLFDSPSNGGLWFTGITAAVEVKPDNKLNASIDKIVKLIAKEVGDDAGVAISTERYHDQEIRFVNVTGVPMPFAPAWAEYDGRLIVALYPQMIRSALDRMIGKAPSLLDNPDFVRGRKLLPADCYSLGYVDAKAGIRQLYSFALPLSQVGVAMLQGEGIPADISMLPSAETISRHMFGNVSGQAIIEDGVLSVSHGAIPAAIPAIGEGGFAIPLMVSVALPSLARAREMARRTTSAANMNGIVVSCLIYAESHKGEFPPDLETLTEGGDSAYLQPQSLVSPKDQSGSESSYVYIEGQKNTMDPRNVLVYERPDLNDGEGVNVAFLDGHTRFYTIDEFREELAATYERLEREMPEDLSTAAPEAQPTKPADTPARTEKDVARALVDRGGKLASQIELFYLQVGRYPSDLKELVEAPANAADAKKWSGPYVKSLDMLKDPWGRELHYKYDPDISKTSYLLWSVGQDGQDGTEDDIGNWKQG